MSCTVLIFCMFQLWPEWNVGPSHGSLQRPNGLLQTPPFQRYYLLPYYVTHVHTGYRATGRLFNWKNVQLAECVNRKLR